MSEKFILGIADYCIVGIMLVVSTAIGIFFRFFGEKQKTNEEYLLAGRNMSIGPVAFSLMATYVSAISLMAVPTDIYLYGTCVVFMNVGFILGPIIASFLFLPIYFNTGVSTSYEYLGKRFGKSTRRILSVLFVFHYVLFGGIVLYAPALALNAVTNLSLWASVTSVGIVCTCYCTLGGMKAVLWTDVFQSVLIYICILAVIIKGCMDHGGIIGIFDAAYDGGRLVIPTLNMDFSTRYTMLSVLLQGLIITTYAYGTGQVQVQRQLTLKTLRRSVIANLISIPLVSILDLLSCFCGLILYVHFKSCDPVTSPDKSIQAADQLIPYYIISTMRQYPGLPGLCIAGIFSAAISTISSIINSMAAVTYEDIIRPIWPTASGSVLITKTATMLYGGLAMLFAYFVSSFGNLAKISYLMMGLTPSPTLAVFLLGALTTSTNEMGANLGMVAGFVLSICLTLIPNKRYYPPLPVENNCSLLIYKHTYAVENSTFSPTFNMSIPYYNTQEITNTSSKQSPPPDNFPVSYMWISPMSFLVCLAVGYFGSCIISYFRRHSEPVPAILLSPVRQRFYKENKDQHFVKLKKNKFRQVSTRSSILKFIGRRNNAAKHFQNEQHFPEIQPHTRNTDELSPLQLPEQNTTL